MSEVEVVDTSNSGSEVGTVPVTGVPESPALYTTASCTSIPVEVHFYSRPPFALNCYKFLVGLCFPYQLPPIPSVPCEVVTDSAGKGAVCVYHIIKWFKNQINHLPKTGLWNGLYNSTIAHPQNVVRSIRPAFTHSKDTVFCTACKDAFSKEAVKADDFRRRRRNQHHGSSEDLAKAVEQGCYFCKRFARHSADPSISTVLKEDLILHPRPDPVRLFFAGSEQHTGRAWGEDDLDDLSTTEKTDEILDDEPPARLSPRMDSQDAFITMQSGSMTALIDAGDSGSHWWKVITTEHHQTPANYGGYLTLSHRWGSLPFAQLTSDTLPAFQNNTAIKSLPKTFRDTIALAHHFNIRHIWIDSLCIL
ncbi:uncharacterized protein CLUP02_15172 [Colletotrichum lupini]|uniref:Heterokaryon incompatibility domain-containing protein n=1 Tax=Colletotrichum lupini TaxID=145971 RepID=A0A9Q8T5K6_9PEZI|nr:uncharacterized protein CLUP02_15172 [Colletotrichum lupini]UQC89641.1 hypothetical protein CLUP02_15172 [Colletotrichum lupini]